MKRGGDLSDTGVHRLLQRIAGDSRQSAALTHAQLMEASDRRLTSAAQAGSDADKLVAERLLGCPREYQGWEEEHAKLMQRVASHRRAHEQRNALLVVAFGLIHRKALFEHLRDKHICGSEREQLFAHFRGRDFAKACVQEHANYLRSTASYLCVRAIGARLMSEPAFDRPLSQYHTAYARYFEACCQVVLESGLEEFTHSRALLGSLRREAEELREELLGGSPARSGSWKRPPATVT